MEVARSAAELAALRQRYRSLAFVPTMGALHDGHRSLLENARRHIDAAPDPKDAAVVLSVFVNPTQFGPGEDLSRYPRTLEADLAMARAAGVAIAYVPAVESLYPEGLDAAERAASTLALPEVATRPQLEDRARPGHFGGVALVVGRLFDQVRPRWAIFGEKDYQQLRVIEAMVASDRNRFGGLEIVASPTCRDADGLAMSSRNRYLRAEDRDRALGLVRALRAAESASDPASAERAMRTTLEAHGLAVDYAVVRDSRSLLPLEPRRGFSDPARALVAARLGWTDESGDRTVRLIDNAPVPGRR